MLFGALDRMTNHSLKFLRCTFARIGEIDFVM